MDTLFIHEAPDRDAQRKRRLRVVTSCDECRERKIKCIQAKPDAADQRCDACIEASIRCEYKDKARYYAEKRPSESLSRSSSLRAVAAASIPPRTRTPGSRPSTPRVAAQSQIPSGLPAASSEYGHSMAFGSQSPSADSSSSGFSYGSLGTSSGGSASDSPATPASLGKYTLNPTIAGHQTIENTAASTEMGPLHPLFDSQSRSPYPHPALMSSLLLVFFQAYGASHVFVSYEESIQKHLTSTLSPVLANVMAAMAAPFSISVAELAGYDLQDVGKRYMATAKKMLPRYLQGAVSSSTLHAVILISWFEASRTPFYATEFQYYSELALQIATRFGLNDPTNLFQMSNGNPAQLLRLQATWSSICGLFPAGPPSMPAGSGTSQYTASY